MEDNQKVELTQTEKLKLVELKYNMDEIDTISTTILNDLNYTKINENLTTEFIKQTNNLSPAQKTGIRTIFVDNGEVEIEEGNEILSLTNDIYLLKYRLEYLIEKKINKTERHAIIERIKFIKTLLIEYINTEFNF